MTAVLRTFTTAKKVCKQKHFHPKKYKISFLSNKNEMSYVAMQKKTFKIMIRKMEVLF